MLNGINQGDELNNTRLSEQLGVTGIATNPVSNPYKNLDRNLLIDETAVSHEAVKLYEKEQDVKQFTSLVTSDPDDLSHEQIVAGLFSKGVSDPLSEESVTGLASNKKLLEDLSL